MARDNKEYQITLQSPISNLCNFTMFHFSVSSLFTIDVTLLSLSFPRQTTVARQRSARGSNKQSHTLNTLETRGTLVLVETIPWQVPPPSLPPPHPALHSWAGSWVHLATSSRGSRRLACRRRAEHYSDDIHNHILVF